MVCVFLCVYSFTVGGLTGTTELCLLLSCVLPTCDVILSVFTHVTHALFAHVGPIDG